MSRLELRLLGPPELHLNGQKLVLPTRKLLGLLAYLALEGPTSRAKLADLFWSDTDEESARGNLRRELNRLRHTPLASGLEAERDLIWLGEVYTDVAGFRECLAAGRLQEALALCRGELLEGLELSGAAGFEGWLQVQRETLAQTRYAALAQYAEQLEAAGDLRGALTARLELLRQDELQELHHREAMRLHALLGEREAALGRYERLREILWRELGLEPLPQTQHLAERIRRAEAPSPPPSPPPPAARVKLDPPLSGRGREWQLLEKAYRSWMTVFISGEPGVGKTRLMQEFAASTGLPVAHNRGSPGDAGIPYATAARFIRSVLALEPGLRLEPWVRRELARFVPELGEAEHSPIHTPEERLRLFEAYCAFTRAQTAFPEPFVVLVDDLQFFDSASNEMFAFETAQAIRRGARRLTLVAFRKEELSRELERPLQDHVEAGLGLWIELMPLSETDLLRLVRSLSGSSGAVRFTKRLYTATGGNPLFTLETLKVLLESGELRVEDQGWSTPYDQETSDYRELPLPTTVREAALRRVAHLGEAARRFLEAASLAGDGFGLEELEGATALSGWESLEALERTLQVGLLEREGQGYRFHHELLRRAIEEDLSPERRRLLHLKLAANLERLSAPPARIAYHLEQGGKPQAAIPWRIQAAEAALRVYAHAEALEHYQQALTDGPEGAESFSLRKQRARILATLDDRKAWEEEILALRGLAASLGRPDLEAEASLEWARFYNSSARYAQALEEAEKARTFPPLAAQAQHQAGLALMSLGQLSEAEAQFRAALEAPPPEGTPERGQIHFALCNCTLQRGDLAGARRQVEEALQHFRRAGYRRGEVEAWARMGLILGLSGQTAEAIALLAEAAAQAQEMGERALERVARLNLFKFLFESGQLETALPHLERGLELAREPQDPRLEGLFLNNLAVVHRARGELGRALECFRGALEIAERMGIAQFRVRRRLALAENHLDLGDPTGAQSLLEEAQALADAVGLGEVEAWQSALWARCDLLEGRPEAVLARLLPLLEAELADHNDRARAAWLLGAAWLRLGDPEQALQVTEGLEALPALRVRLLATALEARLSLGQLLDLEAAQQVLEDPGVALLESFDLRRALVRALYATGKPEAAKQVAQETHRKLHHLAATLAGHPKLQESFLGLYPDLLG